MFSHKYKSIFIHIPKAAGTSIERKLGHFERLDVGVQDHRTIREIEPIRLDYVTNLHREDNLFLLMRRMKGKITGKGVPTAEQYKSYFKFTFVRNSWSRVVSWYKNVMRDENHRRRLGVREDCSFEEFIEKYLNQTWALRSQMFWITNYKGKIPLDFIGRFERLGDDFAEVCSKLNIPDGSLPELLVTDSQEYTSYYNNKLIDIVEKKYKREIDYFKFEYGE